MKHFILILLSVVCMNVYASDYVTNNLRYSNNNYTMVVRSDNPYEYTPILIRLGNKENAIKYLDNLITTIKNTDNRKEIKIGKYNTTLFTELGTYKIKYDTFVKYNIGVEPDINDYYTLLFPNPSLYTAGTYRLKLSNIIEAYDKIRN